MSTSERIILQDPYQLCININSNLLIGSLSILSSISRNKYLYLSKEPESGERQGYRASFLKFAIAEQNSLRGQGPEDLISGTLQIRLGSRTDNLRPVGSQHADGPPRRCRPRDVLQNGVRPVVCRYLTSMISRNEFPASPVVGSLPRGRWDSPDLFPIAAQETQRIKQSRLILARVEKLSRSHIYYFSSLHGSNSRDLVLSVGRERRPLAHPHD